MSASGERGASLETRTFALQHMEAPEAVNLIDPYVYSERVGAPGMVSAAKRESRASPCGKLRTISTESPQSSQSSTAPVQVRWRSSSSSFRPTALRQADRRCGQGVGQVPSLRWLSLEGEAVVSLVSGAFHQRIRAEQTTYDISGVYRSRTQALQINVRTNRPERFGSNTTFTTVSGGRHLFSTEVVIQPGKTLVLGTVTEDEATAILVVRSLVTDEVDASPAEA